MKSGWQIRPLGDMCEFQRGLTYSKGDEVDLSDNAVLRAMNIDLASHLLDFMELKYISDDVVVPPSKKVRKGSLLICTASGSRSHLGKVAFIDNDYGYAFGGFMGMLTPKRDLDPRYLFHLMTSGAYEEFIGSLASGMNINNLKFDELRQFQVPYPSLREQRRLIALLDEALAAVATARANTEQNLGNTRELIDAATQSLFPAGSQVLTGARHLEELCDLIVDCEHKTAPTQNEGIPSIRTPNIGKGRLILDDVYRVSEETYREWTRRAAPKAGDLILAREAPAGNVAVIPDGLRVCLGQRTVLIRPNRLVFEPAYLAHLLLGRDSQERLLAHSRGATVQHVNVKDIRALKLWAVPSLETQRAVVERIDRLLEQGDALADALRRKIAALHELKQSLLHQAFSGAM